MNIYTRHRTAMISNIIASAAEPTIHTNADQFDSAYMVAAQHHTTPHHTRTTSMPLALSSLTEQTKYRPMPSSTLSIHTQAITDVTHRSLVICRTGKQSTGSESERAGALQGWALGWALRRKRGGERPCISCSCWQGKAKHVEPARTSDAGSQGASYAPAYSHPLRLLFALRGREADSIDVTEFPSKRVVK